MKSRVLFLVFVLLMLIPGALLSGCCGGESTAVPTPIFLYNMGEWVSAAPYLMLVGSVERTPQYNAVDTINAPQGTVFIIVTVTITNGGSSDVKIGATDFRLVDSGNIRYPPQEPAAIFYNPFPYQRHVLHAGEIMGGRILFNVPDVSWGLSIRTFINGQNLAWVLPW